MRSQMGVHILAICTRRLLRLVFWGWLAARDAPRRRRPGRVPTRKKRLANGPRMSRAARKSAGRVHLAGLGMDEARPGQPPMFPGRGTPPPFLHPPSPGLSGYPAGARLTGSAIERRAVWAMSRPEHAPFPLFPLRYLVHLTTRPGRGWLVQQLSGDWFGLCPGRGTPPLPFFTPHSAPDPQKQ